ncbi:hypothetical protein BDN70DRAFT_497450 [Pholiota conissans]|uniref:Uncharacterized protein n=1 Tax=Pholiota conissans TaxID=109636 RepID=A0A9P5Z6P6_9AGAR|nr:hypothetical protein BDN70DRAFT_497450 [Pholiota conissans]
MNRPHTRSFHGKPARSPRPASHSELRSTQNLSSSQTMKANHELSVPSQHLEEHLKQVQDGIQSMACEMKDLRKKNASLQEKLTLMEQSPIKTRSRRRQIESDSEIDDSQIQELETIIEDLKVV